MLQDKWVPRVATIAKKFQKPYHIFLKDLALLNESYVLKITNRPLLQEESRDSLTHVREISNANCENGTKEESEINTGSISLFKIASSMCKENGEELYICFEIMEMKDNKVKLLIKATT